MSAQDPFIGQKFGDYVIQSLLGKGGMARVYKAVDPNLDRLAAIKVIDPGVADNPDYTRRFKREAQAIARLSHPNIVSIYQFGVAANGMYYMAMAFIEGADLAQVIRNHHKDGATLSNEAVLRIASQIGSALDYAHGQGVIHRDVKPGNIMVTAQGRAILTDFGLVRDLSIPTLGEIFGSPDYISPEQAVNSAKAVPQSDIYSLGVTLYEMLAGCLPFESDNPNELALMHIGATPPPLHQFQPNVSPAVEAVVMRCLAKRVEDRYQTGGELFNALRQAVKTATAEMPAAAASPLKESNITHDEQVIDGLHIEHYHEARGSRGVPLLFVHGAWGGSWIFSQYLPYLAAGGWDCYALNLRGHYKSPAAELTGMTLWDYARDVARIVRRLPSPPVLIGFGTGAHLIQLALDKGTAAVGAVFISAATPNVAPQVVPADVSLPLIMAGTPIPPTADLPSDTLRWLNAQITKAVEPRSLLTNLLRGEAQTTPQSVSVPYLVLNGELDSEISPEQGSELANYYKGNGTFDLVPGASHHGVMLGIEWRAGADSIHAWQLKNRFHELNR